MVKAFFRKVFPKKKGIECLCTPQDLSTNQLATALNDAGLYKTILSTPHIKHTYAYIIALYAIGDREKAETYLSAYQASKYFKKHFSALIQGLLPFCPQVCYTLLEEHGYPNPLLQANFLAAMDKTEALQKLYAQTRQNDFLRYPEWYLTANRLTKQPSEQLNNLNAYLRHYDLAPLNIIDDNQAPKVTNFCYHQQKSLLNNRTASPLVSIIVTAFNSAEYITNALLSLIHQTYANTEIIVIDDVSTDNTVACVRALAQKYPCIKWVALDRNIGTYAAKTIGVYLSQGEFVTCQDADDWAHPSKIALQMAPLLRDKKLIVSFSKWIRLQNNGSFYARAVSPLTRLNPSSALFRKKEVIEHAGLWDWVRTGADSEFNARLRWVFKHQFVMINKPLTIGAHRENSLMTASATGYASMQGTLNRLDYWESWNAWHIQAMQNKTALKLNPWAERCFDAPASICVNKEDIRHCFEQFVPDAL